MNPCELSHWPARLESPFALWRISALPLFMTCERCELANSPEIGSKPASTVPMIDQSSLIGSLMVTPMTDWLMLFGDHSHFEPWLCFKRVEIGVDQDGEAITSCVVEEVEGAHKRA